MRRALPDVLAAAGVAVAIALFLGHAFPDYDALYALVWGDDIVEGRTPHVELEFAPAAHPLFIAAAAAVAPLGDGAADAFRWLVLLSTGALCVGLFRLGQALFAWPVGLLAATLMATRVPTLAFGSTAFVDLPAAALVVWAAVLEARSPRRGSAVLVLLALAGLLRPELWLMAAAYLAWCAPPLAWAARLRLAAVAAAGPVIWALSELALTGDPLRPLNEKNADLSQVGARTGLADAPEALARDLGGFLQAPALVLAGLGLVAGGLWLRRRIALPAALAALNGVAFLVLAATGQPLEQRYLFVAAVAGCLLAAVAVLGWTALRSESPLRRRWRAAGALGLVALVALSAPRDVDRAGDLRDRIALGDAAQDDLRDLVESPGGGRALRSAGAYVVTARPVPFVAFFAERRPRDLAPRPAPASASGVLLLPATQPAEQLLVRGIPDPSKPVDLQLAPPPGWRLVAGNRSWRLYSSSARASSRGRPAPPL